MIHYLLKPSRFIPDEFESSVFEVDFKSWYEQGKRVIISDLDNTLISYQESKPTPDVLSLFQALETLGYTIIIISNNTTNRLNTFTEDLTIDGHANARKPLLKTVKKAINGYPLDTILFVGDQLMTDVWAANRLKVTSILVNPIKRKTEKWYTRFNRRLETRMLSRIKKTHPIEYEALRLDERR